MNWQEQYETWSELIADHDRALASVRRQRRIITRFLLPGACACALIWTALLMAEVQTVRLAGLASSIAIALAVCYPLARLDWVARERRRLRREAVRWQQLIRSLEARTS